MSDPKRGSTGKDAFKYERARVAFETFRKYLDEHCTSCDFRKQGFLRSGSPSHLPAFDEIHLKSNPVELNAWMAAAEAAYDCLFDIEPNGTVRGRL